jgi:hypothetical protein
MTWPTKTDFVDGDVLTAAQVNNIGTNLNEADPTSATLGQVLTADGAGGMAFQDAGGGGLTEIATTSLTSGTSYSFTSIPGTYKHLLIVAENVTYSGYLTHLGLQMNGNTATNHAGILIRNNSQGGSLAMVGQRAYYGLNCADISVEPIGNSYTNSLNYSFWQIWNYTDTASNYKNVSIWGSYFSNNSRYVVSQGIGLQASTSAAITSVQLVTGSSTSASTETFVSGTATLYGVQ